MRDGLYKVQFKTPEAECAGVVVLKDNHVSGGDDAHYYSGEVQQFGNRLTGTMAVRRHTNPNHQSVFESDMLDLKLTGTVQLDQALATGTAEENPDVQIRAELVRLCD